MLIMLPVQSLPPKAPYTFLKTLLLAIFTVLPLLMPSKAKPPTTAPLIGITVSSPITLLPLIFTTLPVVLPFSEKAPNTVSFTVPAPSTVT